jgi:hypothetical protein
MEYWNKEMIKETSYSAGILLSRSVFPNKSEPCSEFWHYMDVNSPVTLPPEGMNPQYPLSGRLGGLSQFCLS